MFAISEVRADADVRDVLVLIHSEKCNREGAKSAKNPRRMKSLCLLRAFFALRSEEHTSELQSPCNLVCRLLLEKKKTQPTLRCPPDTETSDRWRIAEYSLPPASPTTLAAPPIVYLAQSSRTVTHSPPSYPDYAV